MGSLSDVRKQRAYSSPRPTCTFDTPTRPTSAKYTCSNGAISPRKRQPSHRDTYTGYWGRSDSGSSKRTSLSMESSPDDGIPARYYESSRDAQSPRSRRGQAKLVAATFSTGQRIVTPTPPRRRRGSSPHTRRIATAEQDGDWYSHWKQRGARRETRSMESPETWKSRREPAKPTSARREFDQRTPQRDQRKPGRTTPQRNQRKPEGANGNQEQMKRQTTRRRNVSITFNRSKAPAWQVLLFDKLVGNRSQSTRANTTSPLETSVRTLLATSSSYNAVLSTCRNALGLTLPVVPTRHFKPSPPAKSQARPNRSVRNPAPSRRGRSLVEAPSGQRVSSPCLSKRGHSVTGGADRGESETAPASLGRYSRLQSAPNSEMYYDQSDYERIAIACGWKVEDMFAAPTTQRQPRMKTAQAASPAARLSGSPTGSPRLRTPAVPTTRRRV